MEDVKQLEKRLITLKSARKELFDSLLHATLNNYNIEYIRQISDIHISTCSEYLTTLDKLYSTYYGI